MKKIYFLLTFIAFTTTVMAQTKGISYQAVLYDPAYKNQTLPGVDNTLIPYANKPVCLRFQITDKNNQAVYIETQSTKTDPFGMVNLIIGQGTKIGGSVSNFENINWNAQANGLIVSLDNSGNCSNFTEVTNQPFTASPFSLGTTSINTADYEIIANKSNNITVDGNSTTKYPSVNAVKTYIDSKVGTIPDADATTKGKIQLTGDLGGTSSLPTVPGLALKVDKEVGKGLSTNDFTTIEKNKLSGITGINTGDQDLSAYATIVSIGSKQEVSNISNNIQTDANSTTKYPSVKGIKDYVDGLNSAGGVSDNSITSIKITDNAIVNIDVSPSASIDFSKLNISKSDIIGLGISKTDLGLSNVDNTTDLAKPISTATQFAIDAKVDKETGKGLSSNDYTAAEKTKLGAITGTNTGDQTFITGNAGTATKLAATKNINGVAFDGSTDITVAADAGTLTGAILASNVLTSSLTSVGTLANLTVTSTISGSVSGNASTVTTNANLTGPITSVGNATTITDSAVTNAKLDKTNIPLSGFGAALVDVALGAKKLTGVADPIDAQDAATKAYADTKASKVEITSTEIILPTKINAKQLYSISGTLNVNSGSTSATIPQITGLSDYYSIRIFSNGKPFRNEVRSFTVIAGSPIAVITGNGMMSEVYPSGSYTYVLEYFK